MFTSFSLSISLYISFNVCEIGENKKWKTRTLGVFVEEKNWKVREYIAFIFQQTMNCYQLCFLKLWDS